MNAQMQSPAWIRFAARILACLVGLAAVGTLLAAPPAGQPATVPGVVIDHSPQSSGLYIGSPSLTILPDGAYVASHDFFGPKSAEHEAPTTAVFRSMDRGASWQPAARLRGLFWANLFVHRGELYLLGTDKHHGRLVIRRSKDGGQTWTEPADGATGLLTATGQYHTAPVPVVEWQGRLWRAVEDAMGGTEWGRRYRPRWLSVAVEADLLQAANWTLSEPAVRDDRWLDGAFRAWLEGNAVVGRDQVLHNILRVDTPGLPERAALLTADAQGRWQPFQPERDVLDFPGGAKKFTIRFDAGSDRYWTLATVVAPGYGAGVKPATVRNTLALLCSEDLRRWETRCVLLHHPDTAKHGFQYPDWLVEGEDLVAVVRTAFDDEEGGAHNNHDANYLTFHRFKQFRRLTPADSVRIAPAQPEPPSALRIKTN